MNPTAGLFFSLAMASAGFSVLRLSLKDAGKELGLTGYAPSSKVILAGAVLLIGLSALPWVFTASTPTIGWLSWFFCTTALAPLALIALWPFSPRAAVLAPPGILLAIALAVSMA